MARLQVRIYNGYHRYCAGVALVASHPETPLPLNIRVLHGHKLRLVSRNLAGNHIGRRAGFGASSRSSRDLARPPFPEDDRQSQRSRQEHRDDAKARSGSPQPTVYGGAPGVNREHNTSDHGVADSGGDALSHLLQPTRGAAVRSRDILHCLRLVGGTHGAYTVKPLALMRYLVRLVTPPGGIVLDPFAGSGTTLQAASEEGFNWIGIEKDPGHIPFIEERLRAADIGFEVVSHSEV